MIRESRAEVKYRPRNLEVEKAWRGYAQAFEEWQLILNASTADIEDARMIALRAKSYARDAALFEYFEIYDQDQREAFSEDS